MSQFESIFSKRREKKQNQRGMVGWLFTRLALQNVMRRPVRTFMLVLSVAFGTAAVFASFTVGLGMEKSMDKSFSRMGADLIVVPQNAMVNITSALLTVQPTDATMDLSLMDQIAHLDGVAAVAPQTIYRMPIMAGMPNCKANVIAFDAARDFTVMPWLDQEPGHPMKTGELLAGCRRAEAVGEEVQPCDMPSTVYGKLGRSGVGPFDESFFATYDTVAALAATPAGAKGCAPPFDRAHLSAVLVKLKFGATVEQVRFAISRFPGVKVIGGARVVTATRQTTTALLAGMQAFTALMVVASLILVGLLFSAIISERQREVGLLRAIGARRSDVVWMLLIEAAFTTGMGGLLGLLLGGALLLGFQRSLVYYLETLHVEFAWPMGLEVAALAGICLVAAVIVGFIGAALPAWRTSAREAYILIQGESG